MMHDLGFWLILAGIIGAVCVAARSGDWRPVLIRTIAVGCACAIGFGWVLQEIARTAEHAPRYLIGSHREIITNEVKRFSGTPFVLMTASAAEPLDYALSIANHLRDAGGWDWRAYPAGSVGLYPDGGKPKVGFSVLAHIEVQARSLAVVDAARALTGALKRIGNADVRMVVGSDDPSEADARIFLIVGTKR